MSLLVFLFPSKAYIYIKTYKHVTIDARLKLCGSSILKTFYTLLLFIFVVKAYIIINKKIKKFISFNFRVAKNYTQKRGNRNYKIKTLRFIKYSL